MMTLEEKLRLWVKITGVNPTEEQKSYAIYFDDRLSEYDIRKMDEKIREAINYDCTGLFAEAYLCHYFKEYIKQRGFNLAEYITNTSLKDYLNDVCMLNNELQQSDAEKMISEEANKAMAFYGLNADELTVFDIAEIRTCANNCIDKNLNTIQFSSGPTQNNDFKMSKEIRMYKDLNSLIISSAKGNVDGVSMAYIRDEEEITYSYFSFIIKNGENLYVLTDKPAFVHPLQSSYKRCPGRDMYSRIEGNMFPYSTVANINISDLWGRGRYGTSEKNGNLSTVLRDENGEERLYQTIGTIEQLSQGEAFWFVMMLSLIKEKFYENEAPQLTLSYTGTQIKHPAIENTENALMVQSKLPSLSMEQISFEDIHDITFESHYEEHLKSNWNQYLIDRYKDRINEDVLNIVDNESIPLLSEYNSSGNRKELHPFGVTNECGTAEELNYRQRWIGRYNYAISIKNLLQKDYDDNCKQIYQDIEQRIKSRLEDIVIAFLQNKLVDKKLINSKSFERVYEGKETPIGEILTYEKWWSEYHSSKYLFGCTNRYGRKADYRCAISGDAPGVVFCVNPRTIYSLCQICGCEVKDLSEFIQHWSKSSYYYGNPILSNIDPIAYILGEDPFNEMEFSVSIVLSKKEYLRLCEKAGVEARKFWLEEKPLCLKDNEEICPGDWPYNWEKGRTLKKKCAKCKYYKGNVKQENTQSK